MCKTYLFILSFLFCSGTGIATAQDVTITIDAKSGKKAVSPYIYGRNNTFDKPARFYKDAGLRFARMNGGNNATKYNWRLKISSHPDWYNNVYANDWDKTSKSVATNYPNMQVMWAFQLLGRVASNKTHNFDDWGYNHSKYWFGVGQNLAGGGIPDTTTGATKALVEGDINLYTMEWPSDSTVEILNHWFGPDGIGLDKEHFRYWNMDNEPDIWNGTHDDVMPILISASKFMDRFIEVAKKARALYPEIKICGPVTTSEWQWYKWGNEGIKIDGKYYCWLEYFIKRCADEEKATGIRVLDVVDLHNYPWAKNGDIDVLQLHRMYYDQDYIYAGANGLKTINGGWDNSQNKEYIFKRINDWLTLYFGENHGITLGLSEWSPASSESNPNASSVVYASHLGTFANNGVEYFTPWTWFNGMWETLHLFSRYAKGFSVSSTSSVENTVSAYTTVNETADSMTVVIVNRDMSSAHNVTVNLNEFSVPDRTFTTLQLSSLPSSETFKSHTDNALKKSSVTLNSNSFTLSVPTLSTTAVLLTTSLVGIEKPQVQADDFKLFPNPANDYMNIEFASNYGSGEIHLFTLEGNEVLQQISKGMGAESIDISGLCQGIYIMKLNFASKIYAKKIIIN